jgi:glycyl-tRNA synthetase
VKQIWWKAMTRRPDICGIDASILMHPTVWKASGHVDGFSDPLVDCKNCKARFRADNTESYLKEKKCPQCGSTHLSEPRQFNLMFKTFMGPVEEAANLVYLRPETAQGHYVNFQNCQISGRYKIPFGIAAIGKSFRNEITPGHFIFRMREFEQMEMQYFIRPGEDEQYFEQWLEARLSFYQKYGINSNKIRQHEHAKEELAHYCKRAIDIQYLYPMGWSELEGIHNRTNFDLTQHSKFSGKNLEYFDEASKEKFVPYAIETAVGCDRLLLTFLVDAYREEEVRGAEVDADKATEDVRVVLGFHPEVAPIKACVMPLSKKAELLEISEKLYQDLLREWDVQHDEAGSIGKRYRRQDEVGTPFCITVDFNTLQDRAVTFRHRDSMKQERIPMLKAKDYLADQLRNFWEV